MVRYILLNWCARVFASEKNPNRMSSCDEAERLIVYRAGYQAFLSTNVVCLILCIVIFIFTFLFKTDIMGFVYVCMILLVNNVSYMMRAAKLERRR